MVSMVLICVDPNRRCHNNNPTACHYHYTTAYDYGSVSQEDLCRGGV